MDKKNITEIKKGEIGTGLLIEHDGYISLNDSDNKPLMENIKMLRESKDGNFHCPYPFIVHAVFQKYGIENANGRIYPEAILKKEVERYQEKIKERRAIGECNHPSEATIDLSRVAINIIELHWEGRTLVGQLEVITTEGFRKTGIVSTCGDEVANLLLNGIKIGVSSRGLGSVEKKLGSLIVGDDFELVCFDVVSDPSTPGAFIGNEMGELKQYVENKISNENTLLENLKKYDNWLGE